MRAWLGLNGLKAAVGASVWLKAAAVGQHRVEASLGLVDGGVDDGRIVDGSAARSGRGSGQHPDHAGIFQGNTNGLVQRQAPFRRLGPGIGDGSRRYQIRQGGTRQLSRVAVSDGALLGQDDVAAHVLDRVSTTDGETQCQTQERSPQHVLIPPESGGAVPRPPGRN